MGNNMCTSSSKESTVRKHVLLAIACLVQMCAFDGHYSSRYQRRSTCMTRIYFCELICVTAKKQKFFLSDFIRT